MRREALYLRDIVEAADSIRLFIEGADAETLATNHLLRSAVLHQMIVLGEAAARVPPATRELLPEVAWKDIIAFRNILVHAYFRIDLGIVWKAIINDVPAFSESVSSLLAERFPDEAASDPSRGQVSKRETQSST